jgi:UDP-N-acetylglucosamine--N-acetylmuramyl-(pentapeptide) pyrophosphoryl-undecaprenol N-acetylglucosamine transferase
MIERIIVAGGGTGGHLFPGLAVVEELKRRIPQLEVVWVGTARGIEARVIPQRGMRFEALEVTPLKGRSPLELAKSVGRLPGAAWSAQSLIRAVKPDLVIGVGGYASGPLLAAAVMLRVPTAVLEQNAHVGLTNRLLARFVGRAYLSFPETSALFGNIRARMFGNPVRRDFVDVSRRALTDPEGFEARTRSILVLGGSQGARALDENVPAGLAQAGVTARGLQIVHQASAANVEAVRARYAALGVEATVVPFLDDMARAYASASVVVARAGATTLAELCAIGRPSILVPFPLAADDHQTRNADSLARDGAAILLPQAELTPERLASELGALLDDDAHRLAMAAAARRRGFPDAAAAIVDDLCGWLGVAAPGDEGGGGEGGDPHADEPDADSDSERAGTASLDAESLVEAESAHRRVQTSTIATAFDPHASRRRKRRVRAPLPTMVRLGATGTWE